MPVPNGMWECPKCGDYVENFERVCPRCGCKAKSTFVSYSVPSDATNSQPKAEKIEMATIEPAAKSAPQKSSAATFLRVIAWILWIGGLIVAILDAKDAKIDRLGDTHFSFSVFFETLLTYGLLGGFTMCAVELFGNVQKIVNALQEFKITKKPE